MSSKLGKYTYRMDNPPSVLAYAAIGSKKESEGLSPVILTLSTKILPLGKSPGKGGEPPPEGCGQ